MLYFSESYVGGWFGFGRTYGAVARLACDSREQLEHDWPTALAEVAKWRAVRGQRATALHIDIEVSSAWARQAIDFVKATLIVPTASLAQELRGLFLLIHVCTPDMEHYMYVELFPEAAQP